MAKQMSYTDKRTGITHPETYWHVAQVNLNKHSGFGSVLFHGYSDKDHRDIVAGKKTAAAALIIGTKEYTVNSEQFETFFSSAALDAEGANLWKQAYVFADSVEDTPNPLFEKPTGLSPAEYDAIMGDKEANVIDDNGNWRFLLFFADAVDV